MVLRPYKINQIKNTLRYVQSFDGVWVHVQCVDVVSRLTSSSCWECPLCFCPLPSEEWSLCCPERCSPVPALCWGDHTPCAPAEVTHTHTHVSHSGRSSVCRSDSGVDVGVVSRSATRRCCFFNSWDSQSRCLWKVNFEPGSLMMIWGWTVQVRRIESISFYRTLDFEKDKRDSVSL